MSKHKFQKQIDALKASIEKNQKEGFEPLVTDNNAFGRMVPLVHAVSTGADLKSFCAPDRNDELHAGPFAISMGKLFGEPDVSIIKGTDTEGNGAVAWGITNALPAYIYKTAKSLPYTAQGLEYQANASVGVKPVFLYRYATVVNGFVSERSCDFHLAGKLLISQIRELRQQIKEQQESNPEDPSALPTPSAPQVTIVDDHANQGSVCGGTTATSPQSYRTKAEPYTPQIPLSDIPDNEIASLQDELDDLIAEYRRWYAADMEMREFEKNNDLAKLFNDLAQDDIALDLDFPLVGFEQGTKNQWADEKWIPHIVKVSFKPAVITRFEKKDSKDNRIRSVYVNEAWRYHRTVRKNINATTARIPIVRWQDFHDDIAEYIKAQKLKKSNKETGWNAWYCVPNKHLSTEMEYYTFPAWWSLYPSLVIMYATTLMFDKSVARQNDIAWRRIIYVDRGYLEDLYANDENGQDPERQKEIRNELEKKVNDFLSNKANNGKTLMVDSTISDDGKTLINSIRVETIPETSQKTTEDEIHAISSIIFYALGLDPRLVGAVPGKQNSSSGTQARELELLNTKKLATRRERQKRFLLYIAQHNEWCPEHIDVIIRDQTLSTLDRSDTGIVETEL